MSELTKKCYTDIVTVRLRVHCTNAPKIEEYTRMIESEEERNYTVAEVFPAFIGEEQQTALQACRHCENLTQRQLVDPVGIPRRRVSEMENGKRTIGKEMTKRLGEVLKADYKVFL